ncbi:hypothetical protein CAPTEDRAFT_225044 [Capitella teleta]|uniref:Lysosome-associated membrane glycoprotein 5 n=1 Tax=Capitella teleta TaxID=283909 RepID=R7U5I8_CAPTE|nr:hypothetical protein CAPTEDRAFT_225044 [Capitella teleta]|eukprot:ELU01239.1 hypothetical protein CAPTEDRAFT_225044 [Capitella teleta]
MKSAGFIAALVCSFFGEYTAYESYPEYLLRGSDPPSGLSTFTLAADAPRGSWFVNGTDSLCVKFEAGVSFDFKYINTSDKEVRETINLLTDEYNSTTTVSEGFCLSDDNTTEGMQEISINFFEDWKLTMSFIKVTDNSSWYMDNIQLHFSLATGQYPLKNIKENMTDTVSLAVHTFDTNINRSYQCESKQQFINLTGELTQVLQQVNFHTTQVEAFKSTFANTFSSPVTCKDDAVSNIVPIAVGAALGALVLIVLIAYLVGRRRSRQGYESV